MFGNVIDVVIIIIFIPALFTPNFNFRKDADMRTTALPVPIWNAAC